MFDFLRMQFNRGTFNSQASSVAGAVHNYLGDATDTVADILAPGYFPPFFGLDEDEPNVKVGDLLSISAPADSFSFAQITALNPVTVDASGSDNVFPSGIDSNVYNGLNPGDQMQFGPNQTVPIVIGNLNAKARFPGGVITNLIEATSSLISLSLGAPIGQPPTVPRGLAWNQGVGGTIDAYQRAVVSVNWTGAVAAPVSSTLIVEVVNQEVRLSFKAMFTNAQSTVMGAQTLNAVGAIPAFAAPIGSLDAVSTIVIMNNSTPMFGSIHVLSGTGDIIISAGPGTAGDTFPGSAGVATNGFRSFGMMYTRQLI